MIEIEHGGIRSHLTLTELESFLVQLDRDALQTLVIKLAATIGNQQFTIDAYVAKHGPSVEL